MSNSNPGIYLAVAPSSTSIKRSLEVKRFLNEIGNCIDLQRKILEVGKDKCNFEWYLRIAHWLIDFQISNVINHHYSKIYHLEQFKPRVIQIDNDLHGYYMEKENPKLRDNFSSTNLTNDWSTTLTTSTTPCPIILGTGTTPVMFILMRE